MHSLFFLLSGEPMVDCGHFIDIDTVPMLLHDTYGMDCDYVYLMKEDQEHWLSIKDTLGEICSVDTTEKTLTIRNKRAFYDKDNSEEGGYVGESIGFYFFDTKAFRYDKRYILYNLEELLAGHNNGEVFYIGTVFVCKGLKKSEEEVKVERAVKATSEKAVKKAPARKATAAAGAKTTAAKTTAAKTASSAAKRTTRTAASKLTARKTTKAATASKTRISRAAKTSSEE